MTPDADEPIHQDRLWSDGIWTAQVVKNDDGDGWAVAMYVAGETEPALVGPWTMGRDKKNPKPLDTSAFNTLVKTAKEVIRRSEQQRHAELNKNVSITVHGERVRVALVIVPDEEGASASLSAFDAFDEPLGCVPVPPNFKLTRDSAQAWAASGYAKPR